MGIRWSYWLSALGFLGGGLAGLIFGLTTNDPKEDPQMLLGCGLLLGTIGLLFTLWPVLRVREKGVVRFGTMMSGGRQYAGLLVPVSKVKQWLLFLGMVVMGAGALWLMVRSDSESDRVRTAVAGLAYFGCLVAFIVHGVRKKPGILLTEEGILWHAMFSAACFIRWENIASAAAFQKKEQYGKTPALGILVNETKEISRSKMAVNSAVRNAKERGYHLDYEAESLLWPLELVEEVIQFFLKNAVMRPELGTGAAVHRVQEGMGKVEARV